MLLAWLVCGLGSLILSVNPIHPKITYALTSWWAQYCIQHTCISFIFFEQINSATGNEVARYEHDLQITYHIDLWKSRNLRGARIILLLVQRVLLLEVHLNNLCGGLFRRQPTFIHLLEYTQSFGLMRQLENWNTPFWKELQWWTVVFTEEKLRKSADYAAARAQDIRRH